MANKKTMVESSGHNFAMTQASAGGPATGSFGRSGRRRGFTLVEVLVAAAFVGLIFTVLMEAFAVGAKMLEQSQRTTIAAQLAEEIHAMTLTMPFADPQGGSCWKLETGEVAAPPYDDLDDLDDAHFSPPRASDGTVLASYINYAQDVTVVNVSATDFSQVLADGASGVYRVTVAVSCQGTELTRVSWLAMGGP